MLPPQISRTAILTFLLTFNFEALQLNFGRNRLPEFSFSQVIALAQTTNQSQVEVERLVQNRENMYGNRQYNAAVECDQQVLNIYQEINDRKGELKTLQSLGWKRSKYSYLLLSVVL